MLKNLAMVRLPKRSRYFKTLAVLLAVPVGMGLYASGWELRTLFGLLALVVAEDPTWGEAFRNSEENVVLHYGVLVFSRLLLGVILFVGGLCIWRERVRWAAGCLGIAAAGSWWWERDFVAFDERFDFVHFLGHAVYGLCLGNPVPYGGQNEVSLGCLAIVGAVFGWFWFMKGGLLLEIYCRDRWRRKREEL